MKTAWRRTTRSLDARSSGGSSSVDLSRRRRPWPGRLPGAPANHSQSAPRRVLPRRPCYWAYGRNRRLRAINVRPGLGSGSVPRGTRRAQYGAHLAPKKRAPGAAWICRSDAFAIFDRAGGPSRRHRTMTIPRSKPQSGWLRERVSGTPRSRTCTLVTEVRSVATPTRGIARYSGGCSGLETQPARFGRGREALSP